MRLNEITSRCCVYSGYFMWLSGNENVLNKFIRNGKASMGYLISIWVTVVEGIFFCSYSVIDILEGYYLFYRKSERALLWRLFLRNIARYILFSVVFPLSVAVAILFWGLYFWDRELIYPKIMDDVFSPFVNHMMHTYPVPLSILYMFVEIREEPPKLKALAFLTVFMLAYSLVFFSQNYSHDEWIYPVFGALTPSQTNWIIILSEIIPYIFLFVGYYIHSKMKDVQSYFDTRVIELKSR
ncbi:androgen-dependent TFPI-regulating protein isoform X2 [Halyomorpha halys]|uniref:androgen-dependent TFPI-regulating protein isoform X2 n=1 Tax=Halyomorpha halys TaxID=286706 RepID=UPI0034D1876F